MTRYASGAAVTIAQLDAADPELADAIFLHGHPGWTPRDLDELPEHTLTLLRLIGVKTAEANKRG